MAPSNHPFACPHCGAVNQVPAAGLGTVAACTACARPFRAEIPAGKSLAATQDASAFTPLRLHPAPWRPRFAATCFDSALAVGGLASLGYAAAVRQEHLWMWFFTVAGAALVLVGACNLAIPWVRSRCETLEVGAASTRWSKGFFRRRSVEIRHDAVRAVEVKQTFWQRILCIGTLTLASDGNDEDEIVMQAVPGVKRVAERIRELQGK